MTAADREPEQTQETQPAKGKPLTIPVPSKEAVMAALKKAATPEHRNDSD